MAHLTHPTMSRDPHHVHPNSHTHMDPHISHGPAHHSLSTPLQRARSRLGVDVQINYMQQQDEQQRATDITKTLQRYRKRNLLQSQAIRATLTGGAGMAASPMADSARAASPQRGLSTAASSAIAWADGRTPTPPPGPVSPTAAASAAGAVALPQGKAGVRLIYRTRSARAVENTNQGPATLLHADTMHPHSSHLHSGEPASKYPQDFKQVMHNVEKIWTARRAQEVEERLEEMEFRDTIAMWSYNQARIEEESNRRQESFHMCSQTGKQCHKVLRRPHTAGAERNLAADGSPLEIDLTVKKARPTTAGLVPTPPRHPHQAAPPADGSTNGSTSVTAAAAAALFGAGLGLKSSGGDNSTAGHISLSPYDNFDPIVDKPGMRLLRRVSAERPTSATVDGKPGRTAVSTHPEALRSTSLLGATLDVTSTSATVFAPSIQAAIGRPMQREAPKEEEPDPKKGARRAGSRPASARPTPSSPTSGGAPRRPATAGAKKGAKGKRRGPVDPRLIEQIFPVLSVEQEVPSMMRMQQMQQVESIREAFARHGLSLPTSVIEAGILTPEDRPYEECITNLPPPDWGIFRDYTKQTAKPKKKAGRKGKGKKGEKKKKKKE